MHVTKWYRQTHEKALNLFTAIVKKDDKVFPWVFASRKNNPQCSDYEIKPDYVSIIPFLQTANGKKLVMVRQFRPPLGVCEIDFPGGRIEPAESVHSAATRELREETGLTVKRIKNVSPILFSSSGLTDESFVIMIADVVGNPTKEFQDETEDLQILLLDHKSVERMAENYDLNFSAKAWVYLHMLSMTGF